MVLLNGSANRDERHFPDGDSFDIHREIGRHQSSLRHPPLPRAALARLEAHRLDEVLQRFPLGRSTTTRRAGHASTVRGWRPCRCARRDAARTLPSERSTP